MTKKYSTVAAAVLLAIQIVSATGIATPTADAADNFATENLVAWCIVPFDASKRSPVERARMLKRLGLKRCAYDWRKQHVAEFEDEILAYREHGIDFFAFWGFHARAFELFEKYDLHPQVWVMMHVPDVSTDEARIAGAAKNLEPVAQLTAKLKCKLALYNHGGWAGEPKNLVAVCEHMRELGHDHVGIVYNWHHGHGHIDDWKESLALMQPYLHCLNINGMNTAAQPKILAPGKGEHDKAMLQVLQESNYAGPIGILDHQSDRDTEEVLRENLASLNELLQSTSE